MAGAHDQAPPDTVQRLIGVAGAQGERGVQLQDRRVVGLGVPQFGTSRDRGVEVPRALVCQGDAELCSTSGCRFGFILGLPGTLGHFQPICLRLEMA